MCIRDSCGIVLHTYFLYSPSTEHLTYWCFFFFFSSVPMYTSSVVYFCRLCWFTTLEYFSLFLLTCLWILWYRHNLWMIVGHLRFSVHVAALLKFYIFSIVVILSLLLWVLFFLDHKGFFRGSLLNFVSISVVFLLFLSSSMRVWFWVLSLFFWSQFSLCFDS